MFDPQFGGIIAGAACDVPALPINLQKHSIKNGQK